MPASSSTPDFISLAYRPDLHLLVVRWLRDVNLTELQTGFAAALNLAIQHHATNWLIDVRRRGALSASDSSWVADTFLPQASAAVAPAPLQVGYLLAPLRAQAIQEQTTLQATVARAESAGQPYRLRTFLYEADALSWLQPA